RRHGRGSRRWRSGRRRPAMAAGRRWNLRRLALRDGRRRDRGGDDPGGTGCRWDGARRGREDGGSAQRRHRARGSRRPGGRGAPGAAVAWVVLARHPPSPQAERVPLPLAAWSPNTRAMALAATAVATQGWRLTWSRARANAPAMRLVPDAAWGASPASSPR